MVFHFFLRLTMLLSLCHHSTYSLYLSFLSSLRSLDLMFYAFACFLKVVLTFTFFIFISRRLDDPIDHCHPTLYQKCNLSCYCLIFLNVGGFLSFYWGLLGLFMCLEATSTSIKGYLDFLLTICIMSNHHSLFKFETSFTYYVNQQP